VGTPECSRADVQLIGAGSADGTLGAGLAGAGDDVRMVEIVD